MEFAPSYATGNELNKFTGGTKFGYLTFSQPQTQFYDIIFSGSQQTNTDVIYTDSLWTPMNTIYQFSMKLMVVGITSRRLQVIQVT